MTTLYAVNFTNVPNGTILYTLDPNTGIVTPVAGGGVIHTINTPPLLAISIDPASSIMYCGDSGSSNNFYMIFPSPYTPNLNPNGTTSSGAQNGFAFANSDIMYGAGYTSGFLYTINKSGGSTTLVSNTFTFYAIGQDPLGTLYAICSGGGSSNIRLATISPSGTVTMFGTNIPSSYDYYALSYGSSAMYGLRAPLGSTNSEIFQIDLTNANITNIRNNVLSNGNPASISSMTFSPSACIHGSSLVQINQQLTQPIYDIKDNDLIIDANGQQVVVEQNIPCWTHQTGAPYAQEAIIFEKDSLESGLPTQRFAIDPGHPMCTPEQFKIGGLNALKKASDYLDPTNQNIKLTRWDQTAIELEGKNIRYDLVLSKNSCGAYIANGLVVKARISLKDPGYLHEG